MPTIMPHSEQVRRAAEFIALEVRAAREKGAPAPGPDELYKLVEKASLRFDLSPRETASLQTLLAGREAEEIFR